MNKILKFGNKYLYITLKAFEMKSITCILLIIIGFLFLHSETGLFNVCENHHENHDVCLILEKSDNPKSLSFEDFLQNINQSYSLDFLFIETSQALINHFLRESKFCSPLKIKKEKFIYYLKTLLN